MERELDVVKSETGTYIHNDTPQERKETDPYYYQHSPSEQTQYQRPVRSNWKKLNKNSEIKTKKRLKEMRIIPN